MEPLTLSCINTHNPLHPVDAKATLYQLFVDARDRGHVGEIVNLETNTRMTTNEILMEADRFAKGLLSLGCVPGEDTILILSCSSMKSICLFVAACSVGVSYAQPYLYEPKKRNLSLILSQLQTKVVVIGDLEDRGTFDAMSAILTDEKCSLLNHVFYDDSNKRIPTQQKDIEFLDKLIERGEPVCEEELKRAKQQVKPEHTAYHFFTSGSTGNPKCVVHRNGVLANCIITLEDINHGNCLVPNTNIDDTFAYKAVSLTMAGRLGKTVLTPAVVESASSQTVCHCVNAIINEQIDILGTMGAINHSLVQHVKVNDISLPPMKYVLYCGQSNTRQFKEKHQSILGGMPVTMYGMSETHMIGVSSFGSTLEDEESRLDAKLYFGANMEVRLVNDNGEVVDIGKEGEIQIKTHSIFKEYKGFNEETKGVFTNDGYFKTGDMAVMFPDSSFQVLGRKLDAIRFKICTDVVYPGVVETALSKLPGIQDCCVTAVIVNDIWGDEITYCIRLEVNASRPDEDEIIEHMIRHGANELWLPARILYFNSLPIAQNNRKLNKVELKRMVKAKVEEDPDAGITSWYRRSPIA